MSTSQPTKAALTAVLLRFNPKSLWRWFHKFIVLIILSLVVNHLSTPESLSYGELYRFPIGRLSIHAIA